MDTIGDLRVFLNNLTESSPLPPTRETLWNSLPDSARLKVGRKLIDELVSARLSEIHYDARAAELTKCLSEIESHPDGRCDWIGAYEIELDRALGARDYLRASAGRMLEKISGIVTELPRTVNASSHT